MVSLVYDLQSTTVPTVIICPGNGCSNIRQCNWYGKIEDELTQRNIPAVCRDFPDPLHARRDRWIPFIRSLANETRSADDVILIGHSSGAQAALRYAEEYKARGIVLVSATYSDLGDPHERAAGYYPQRGSDGSSETNSYLFDLMRQNSERWQQFHSDDDPFIGRHEAERIRDGLGLIDGTEYHLLPGRSHFFEYSPELLDAIVGML